MSTSQNYTLGFSSCPNDTFIFDAMVHGKIDTEGLTFQIFMEDVEKLNQRAIKNQLDISKLSYHAMAHLIGDYLILDAGSALGKGCGPLLISEKDYEDDKKIRQHLSVAIPGKYTTANLLLSLFAPEMKNKTELLFSDIEDAVLTNQFDTGLIIHENRFTYQNKGLKKIVDLGEFWEKTTGLPIPLGCIAVNKRISTENQRRINRVLRRSVEYAFLHPESSSPYVRQHAVEMESHIVKQHIDLYVNAFTASLGAEGREAVKSLFFKAEKMGVVQLPDSDFFAPCD